MTRRNTMLRKLPVAAALAAVATALVLTACGGGSGGGNAGGNDNNGGTPPGGPPVTGGSDVPVSAQQSAVGAFNFVAATAATKSETDEPLRVGDANLATSDSDDPQPL